jgi:hypothetical protein
MTPQRDHVASYFGHTWLTTILNIPGHGFAVGGWSIELDEAGVRADLAVWRGRHRLHRQPAPFEDGWAVVALYPSARKARQAAKELAGIMEGQVWAGAPVAVEEPAILDLIDAGMSLNQALRAFELVAGAASA